MVPNSLVPGYPWLGTDATMGSQKEQIPRQDLPAGGSAVPSEVQATKGTEPKGSLPSNPMTPRRTRKAEATNHVASIEFALKAATDIVKDPALDELDWLVALKAEVRDSDAPFSDHDLRRYLRQAKLNRDGRKDFIKAKGTLKTREEEWLWRGVIMREATNLIFALPKVGKTRLILAMLSEFVKGRGEFAGLALQPGKERILLLGPDQSENSWSSYLRSVDLCSSEGVLSEHVVAMTTAETMFTLDEYWLTRVEEQLRAYGPLVVVLDSYSAAIRALGLDENKPEAATPLMKLHNLVHQYESTLIVIHHANKAGGEGNTTKASRGSSAITAAADNLIEMMSFKSQEEDGVKKYELRVEGRAETEGTPLIGYSKHSAEWRSYGSAGDVRAELRKDDNYDRLSSAQLTVLDLLIRATQERNEALSVAELAGAINENPTKPQKVAVSKNVKRLIEHGFVVEDPSGPKGTRYKQMAYRPTAWAVSKHSIDF